jgi:uncharacterized protein YraI
MARKHLFTVLPILVLSMMFLSFTPARADGYASWNAEYFNNSFLIAPAVLTRQDAAIAFNWGTGSPGAGVNPDNFSVRWNADVYLAAGRYRFWARADDYIRVTVDYAQQPAVDTFATGIAGQTVSFDVTLQTGYHHIQVEYSETGGNAYAFLTWENLANNPTGPDFPTNPTPVPQPPQPPAQSGNFWTAQYYANPDLAGSPSAIRSEPSPNNNWGGSSPSPNIPADRFSARWVGQQVLTGGTYRLSVRADDGVRVYANGVLVLDEWHNATGQTYSASLNLPAGQHNFVVEYYENTGDAFINFELVPTSTLPTTPQPPSVGTWLASYFDNPNLAGTPVTIQTESTLEHNWGSAPPVLGLAPDNFSVRWTSQQNLGAGTWRLSVFADDGVRVYVNGVLVINEWHGASGQTYTADINLPAGQHNFVVEYYEGSGDAFLRYSLTPLNTGVVTPTAPPTAPLGTWLGVYFNNRDLVGLPTAYLTEREVTHNWGTGAPAPGVPGDNFSARWTSQQELETGTYRITVRADDGVRVYVNGARVIDQWQSATGQTYTADVSLPEGVHTFVVEYYEAGNEAFIAFNLGPATTVGGIGQPAPGPGLWTAYYFNNTDLSGAPSAVRVDTSPAHDWRQGAPLPGIFADNFSVRWVSTQEFDAGTYRITVRADDGVRVFVDGERVIDQWESATGQTYTADVNLTAGSHSLTVEYFEERGDAFLDWEIRSVTAQPANTGATGTVELYRLNVRDLPTTSGSTVIARINPGETYPIVGRNPERTWWQLDIDGNYGWVFSQYIDAANTARVPITIGSNAQPPSTGILATALNTVNIRREPTASSRLLGTLDQGRTATIVGRNATASWYQINYQGVVGWVIADALSSPARDNLSRIPVTG